MGTKKVPFRKAKGSPEKIVAGFVRYITRLKAALVETGSDVYGYNVNFEKYLK